ncbi:MAG: LLM class flavin-dependent oxidoreductase [Pseudomonadota bacterium]
MRISLFAHMERLQPGVSHAQLYDEFVSLCEIADDAGFHTIWTGEHHGMDFTIAPNPLTVLVDLARRTKNVRLGTGTIAAPFWHPLRLAGEIAMTDIMTEGRLEIGIARGAYSFEYERLTPGLDAWGAGQRLREMIPALRGLWGGDYEHDGDAWKFPKTTSSPLPLQQPHPPIWVAARDPNSHQFAVDNGCNVQVTPLWLGDEEVDALVQKFNDACNANSKAKRPKLMLLRHTAVGESEDELERIAKDLSRFYAYFGTWFKNQRPIQKANLLPLSDEEIAGMDMYAPEKMRRNHVVGTPQNVIDRLKRCEDLGFDEYAVWLDAGMSFENRKRNLELVIDHVLPAFH